MQAIILGDPHLGKGQSVGKTAIGSNLNGRVEDQLKLLDWTLEQAVASSADDIIITGDIWEDPKPHPTLIALFLHWLKKCQAYSVKVHLILGNHDMFRAGNVFSSALDIIAEADLENVFVYKEINTITIGTTAFTLVPFRDRKSFAVNSNADGLSLLRDTILYELASIPLTYKKVLVGHLAIEGSIPVGDEIDDSTNELFCPVDMFNGYDYVWMGHVHKPQVMNKNNPYVAHVGSMDISNFGETDHAKNIIVVDCLNNFYVEKKLPTRRLKKITIAIPKDTEDTTTYVIDLLAKEPQLEDAIVRVDISLQDAELKPVNRSQVEKYLLSQKVNNVANISESKKNIIIKRDTSNIIDTRMDVTSAIKTYADLYVDESKRSKFIELSTDIYKEFLLENKE